MKHYDILKGTGYDSTEALINLRRRVNEEMQDGWNSVGGVSIAYDNGKNESKCIMCQAIEK